MSGPTKPETPTARELHLRMRERTEAPKHTPTPWRVEGYVPAIIGSERPDGTGYIATICGSSDHVDNVEQGQLDAAFIVHAVNTRAALVEALRECCDWMRANLLDSDLSGVEAYKQARAALALAGEDHEGALDDSELDTGD